MKKTISKITIAMLMISMLTLAFSIQQLESSEPPETEWNKTYGGTDWDEVRHVIQTSDGGYALVGGTKSYGEGDFDFWLIKTDANGTMQWNQTYGGTNIDSAYCVVQTDDGGYAIAGFTWSSGAGGQDFWLIKTDAVGNHEWNQTYGGAHNEGAQHLIQLSDGKYVIAGMTESFGAGKPDKTDFWLIKTDSAGTMEWNQTYDGNKDTDGAYSVIQTDDGGYAITGHTRSFGAGLDDMWLVKTDMNGNEKWNQTYGGSNWDRAQSMVQTSDGGYALAGHTYSFGAGHEDFWLIKTDANGTMLWNQTYGGTDEDAVHSMVQTRDGGYALAGETKSKGAGSYDFWLVKTNSTGHHEWNQTYGEASDDRAFSVVQTSGGGYAIAGWTRSFGAGDYDSWMIKLAPEEIVANVDIDPDTLNLKSNGEWITAYVTIPEGHSVGDIDVATVELAHNDFALAADWAEVQDGVLMVKFDRATLRDYLGEVDVDGGDKFYDVTLTVTGEAAGTPFEGSDTITVKKR